MRHTAAISANIVVLLINLLVVIGGGLKAV